MIPLINFLPSILPKVPGCTNPVAYEGIKQAVKKLCEFTKAWRFTNTVTSSLSILNLYFTPTNSTVIQINAVRFNGRALEAISVGELDELNPDWRNAIGVDQPIYYTQTEYDTLRLYPVAVGELSIDLTLRPSDSAPEVPDFIFTHFKEAISVGALSYIYMIPGQAFSSPNFAMAYKQEFDNYLYSNNGVGIQGQQKARLKTKPQLF